MPERIKKEDIEMLKKCVAENKSVTIMICKTGLSRVSIINALRKHCGVKSKDIKNLGTPYFKGI